MKNIYLKDFKLNEEGSFSITRPYESLQIIHLIDNFIRYYDKNKKLCSQIITDATACMGGDLVRFSRYFNVINGVEVDENNFKLLVQNCKNFNCENVNLFCQNYLEIYDLLKQDIIYIDPPWGGVTYKNKEHISLKIGGTELWQLINLIKLKKLSNYIFIKVPMNICLDFIDYNTIHVIYNKSKVPSFKLICIKI